MFIVLGIVLHYIFGTIFEKRLDVQGGLMQTVQWIEFETIDYVLSFLERYQLDALPLKLEQIGNGKAATNEDHGSYFVC